MIRHAIFALAASVLQAETAHAQESAPAQPESAAASALLPGSVNLSIVEGSSVPEDCQFPETIDDPATFELACVTMPRFGAGMIGAEYLAQLGRQGWRQGDYIEGGMTAVRIDENNCRRVLNLFPSDFPPGNAESATAVLWFVLERAPRCAS